MRLSGDICVGITTWDDEEIIQVLIDSILNSFVINTYSLMAFDNCSKDKTVKILKKNGILTLSKNRPQACALNELLNRSCAKYTLLIHSDVVFLSDNLNSIIYDCVDDNTILLSPEDIGCGPYFRRDLGANKPESSFMCFNTELAKKMRKFGYYEKRSLKKIVKRPSLVLPEYHFNFWGPHITHDIPDLLSEKNLSWKKMNVEPSRYEPGVWSDYLNNKTTNEKKLIEARDYIYGLGNFYRVDGKLTHYHNWFARTLSGNKSYQGIPSDFVVAYTKRLMSDYKSGEIYKNTKQIM